MKKDKFFFIGSLDPIHNAHIKLIECFPEVILIPTYNPYKNNYLMNIHERIKVLKEIPFKNEVNILDFIIKDPDKFSKMKNIIPELQKLYPNKSLKFIMGTDTYNKIDAWDGYPNFIENFNCVVFPRGKEKLKLNELIPTEVIDFNQQEISSSSIKELIKNKEFDKIKELVPACVFSFILKKCN